MGGGDGQVGAQDLSERDARLGLVRADDRSSFSKFAKHDAKIYRSSRRIAVATCLRTRGPSGRNHHG
jgi:hypothetical protein